MARQEHEGGGKRARIWVEINPSLAPRTACFVLVVQLVVMEHDATSTCLNALGHVELNVGVTLAAREGHSPDKCDFQVIE